MAVKRAIREDEKNWHCAICSDQAIRVDTATESPDTRNRPAAECQPDLICWRIALILTTSCGNCHICWIFCLKISHCKEHQAFLFSGTEYTEIFLQWVISHNNNEVSKQFQRYHLVKGEESMTSIHHSAPLSVKWPLIKIQALQILSELLLTAQISENRN